MLPNSYVFDSVLNLDKCFQNTPPPSTFQIDNMSHLPKNWLIELENKCRKIEPNLEKNIFLKHVGTSSKYELKAVLRKQLSFIYYQISDHLHAELLNHESSQLLLLELTEDIQQCTSGFHIRVNKLVNSLLIPNTLEQLLYLVRKNIVQKTACKLTSFVQPILQIHVVDRVCRIAKKQGLGIEPHIQKDQYEPLSGQMIREILQCEFPKLFTPLKIPFFLAEQLQFILNQTGYTGSEKTGYAIGPAESMLKVIQNFLTNPAKQNTNKLQPLFILDTLDEFGEPTRIYDLNWPLIRQLFFQKLIAEGFFINTPKPANLMEYAYFQALFPKQASRSKETRHISNYLENQNYEQLLDELISIQDNFPKYWQKIIRNPIIIQNINNFFEFIKTHSWNQANAKQCLKRLNLIFILFFSQNKKFILSRIIRNSHKNSIDINYSLLYKSVIYRPKVTNKFLTILFNQQDNSYRLFFDLLFHQNSGGSNLLMLAAQYHTKILRHILFLLNRQIDHCDKEKILSLFVSQNNEGWNIFSLAARHSADSLQFIFDFVKRNSYYFDSEIVNIIFHQKMNSEWDFLQLLVRHRSEDQINTCLDFINEKFRFSNEKKWLEIILNTAHAGHLLSLATRSNQSALNCILNFISKHIKQLDFQTLQYYFSKKNNKGWTCLHSAACSHSSHLKSILDFIQKHTDQFDAHILRRLFLEKNQDQENFLQLAVHYQSAEAVDSIFKFFSQHIELFDKASLQQLLLQQNLNGWNLLSMAYRQPANLTLIFDFINEHPDSFDADTIKKIILQKNNLNYYTCLHFAARFQPDSLKIILEFIDKHFALFINELKLLFENSSKFKVFTTLFRKPSNQTINLLEFSLKHQQESATHFSKFLNTHADEFNLEKSYLKNFIKRATNKILLADEDLKSVVPRIN